MKVRPAATADAAALTSLAMRAKAHWGYSDAFMAACEDELRVTPDSGIRYFCLDDGQRLLGFYGLSPSGGGTVELDGLFVEPDAIARGLGRRLLAHACATARADGASRLVIQSDPNAVGFYESAGARHVGSRPSDSIPGRDLPLLELCLDSPDEKQET